MGNRATRLSFLRHGTEANRDGIAIQAEGAAAVFNGIPVGKYEDRGGREVCRQVTNNGLHLRREVEDISLLRRATIGRVGLVILGRKLRW